MIREEAIAIIENEKKCVNRANKNDYCNRDCYNCELVKTDTEILEALDMAIKALEQQPCDDCISRKEVLSTYADWYGYGYNNGFYRLVQQMESVEPERKPGKWEWDQRTGEYVCSECGCNPIYERTTPDVSEIDKYRFCRWCGAPMEVEADHS